MADADPVSGAIAPGAADLTRAFRTHAPEFAGHQQAEAVHAGPAGLTVLCSANRTGDEELTHLLRLSDNGDVAWERRFGAEHGSGRAMAALPNGGFVIAGDIRRSELEYQAQLLHIDDDGQLLESRPFGPGGVTGFAAVAVLDDGSAVAGGMTERRGWIVSVDEKLNLHWERPMDDVNAVRGLASLADGDFAVAAIANQSTTGFGTTQLSVLTVDQRVRWQQRLPVSGRGEPAAIAARAGRSLVMAGYRSANERDPARCWIACLGTDGTLMWERLIGAAGEERRGRAVTVLADEGVAVVCDVLHDGEHALHVVRLAADGTLAWERAYGGGEGVRDVANDIAAVADGGLVVVGSTTKGPGRTNAWVLRLDADGALLWNRVFGSASTK